jgi:hypothetical protein
MDHSLAGRYQRVTGWIRRGLGCIALVGLLAPWVAAAAVLPESEARAVRAIVQAQLDAFAADDAERAFSYASAPVQAQFGNPSRFMEMVLGGYPMVVRPAAISFFQPETDDAPTARASSVRQVVQLRDREGRLWKAVYLLERSAGEDWRISGCVVAADDGRSMT